MSIALRWYDDEHTILLVEFSEGWTWEQYREEAKTLPTVLASAPDDIDVIQIVDMRETSSVPDGAGLPHILHVRRLRSKISMTIIIGAPIVVQAWVDILKQAYGSEFSPRHIVTTFEEALTLVEQERSNVDS